MAQAPRTLPRTGAWLGVVVLGIITSAQLLAGSTPLGSTAWIVTFSALAALLVAYRLGGGYVTPLNIYALVLVLFTMGLAPLIATGGGYVSETSALGAVTDVRWLAYDPSVVGRSLVLALLFLWILMLPTAIWRATGRVQAIDRGASTWGPRQGSAANVLGTIGVLLVTASVAFWALVSVSALGVFFFLSSYGAFQEATEAAGTKYAYTGVLLGMPLLPLASSRLVRRTGFAAFLLFALPALPVGLRGEVLIPGLSALVVLGLMRPVKIRWFWPLLLLLGLSISATIKQIRLEGLRASQAVNLADPTLGLAELGASLRPTVAATIWREVYGESGGGLQMYWAPFDRLAHSALGLPQVPAEADTRLFNTLIRLRETTIGGSVVGESYYAGGLAFVVALALALGALMLLMYRATAGPYAVAASGMLLAILLLSLRNSVAPIAFQVTFMVAVLVSARVVQTFVDARYREDQLSKRPTRRGADALPFVPNPTYPYADVAADDAVVPRALGRR